MDEAAIKDFVHAHYAGLGVDAPPSAELDDYFDPSDPASTAPPPSKSTPHKAHGAPAPEPDRVIGRHSDGDSILLRPNGTTYSRRPRKGDSYQGRLVRVPKDGFAVDLAELQCN